MLYSFERVESKFIRRKITVKVAGIPSTTMLSGKEELILEDLNEAIRSRLMIILSLLGEGYEMPVVMGVGILKGRLPQELQEELATVKGLPNSKWRLEEEVEILEALIVRLAKEREMSNAKNFLSKFKTLLKILNTILKNLHSDQFTAEEEFFAQLNKKYLQIVKLIERDLLNKGKLYEVNLYVAIMEAKRGIIFARQYKRPFPHLYSPKISFTSILDARSCFDTLVKEMKGQISQWESEDTEITEQEEDKILAGYLEEVASGKESKVFPYCDQIPEGTGWGDVAIKFLNGHDVFVEVRGIKKHKVSYEEMGFGGISKNTPSKLWTVLSYEAKGNIDYSKIGVLPEDVKDGCQIKQVNKFLKTDISKIREKLKRYFCQKIQGDPFPYTPNKGYKASFELKYAVDIEKTI